MEKKNLSSPTLLLGQQFYQSYYSCPPLPAPVVGCMGTSGKTTLITLPIKKIQIEDEQPQLGARNSQLDFYERTNSPN